MISSIQRLLFVTAVLMVSTMMFSLCGCARMSGMVMNESGQAYYEQGNYTLARQEFQKALMDDPTNAHYAFNMAAAAHKQGDIGNAERTYRQALSLDPSYQPAYHGLASLMKEQGRLDEAHQLIANWSGSQPYSDQAHVEMAWIQRELGDPATAEQSLRQALRINPRNEKAVAHLGQIYEQQGRQNEAVAMYQRSLFLDPTQPRVKSRMAAIEKQHPGMLPGMPANGPTRFAAAPGYYPGSIPMPTQMAAPPAGMTYPNGNPTLSAMPASTMGPFGAHPEPGFHPQMQMTNQIPVETFSHNPTGVEPYPMMSSGTEFTQQNGPHSGFSSPYATPPVSMPGQWQPSSPAGYPMSPPAVSALPAMPASAVPQPTADPFFGQQAPSAAPQISQSVPEVRAF